MSELVEIEDPWRPRKRNITWSGLGLHIDRMGRYTVRSFHYVDHPDRDDCWCKSTGHYVNDTSAGSVHRKATDEEINWLPVCKDNYRPPDKKCERCGEIDYLERHHWAPRHLFNEDADNWPIGHLCRSCHIEWHRIVTPDMHNQDRWLI